jgi:hypothetical protein
MYSSIADFIRKDVKEIEELIANMLNGTMDTTDLALGIRERLERLGTSMQSEIYELLDEEIFKSIVRKKKWYVEHKNESREILDVMGVVSFKRRGYVPRNGGKNIYLLDEIIGLSGHQKVTLGAAAQALEEAIESSYSKGGKAASREDALSKEKVKELVHGTIVKMPSPELKEKKKRPHLHIVADEDHVAAQFWEKKGDLERDSNGNKINTLMPKIVVVYEDIIDEAPEGSKKHRSKLTGKKTFCGMYSGTDNFRLWEEVRDYIYDNYDPDTLEKVYIAGDGASWIKTGVDVITNSRFVLDKFHIMKYINTSVAHLEDAEEKKELLWENINGAHKAELKEVYKEILKSTENPNKREDVEKALKYFMNNWEGIEIRKTESGGVWGCCAEAQVSHVLSDRLSSRPMGWSSRGCDHMAKLRAYKRNGGKVIDLLRYQEKEQIKKMRRQEQDELIRDLRRRQKDWKYSESLEAAVPGLEKPDMKWLKNIIHTALDA